MQLVEATEAQDGRPVLIVSASELGARSGGLLAAVGSGALCRVDDHRVGRVVALMIPAADIPGILESFYGIDAGSLPPPGPAPLFAENGRDSLPVPLGEAADAI